jgi:hypothetical protein
VGFSCRSLTAGASQPHQYPIPVGKLKLGGSTSFTSTSIHKPYRNTAFTRLRIARSIKYNPPISTLLCSSIAQAYGEKSSPAAFKNEVNDSINLLPFPNQS